MKTLLLLLTLTCGCAYGVVPSQEEKEYGSTKGPLNDPDAGSSNWGDNYNNSLPYGCFWDNVKEHGVVIASFVICSGNKEMEVKWLVDPPPDQKAK